MCSKNLVSMNHISGSLMVNWHWFQKVQLEHVYCRNRHMLTNEAHYLPSIIKFPSASHCGAEEALGWATSLLKRSFWHMVGFSAKHGLRACMDMCWQKTCCCHSLHVVDLGFCIMVLGRENPEPIANCRAWISKVDLSPLFTELFHKGHIIHIRILIEFKHTQCK